MVVVDASISPFLMPVQTFGGLLTSIIQFRPPVGLTGLILGVRLLPELFESTPETASPPKLKQKERGRALRLGPEDGPRRVQRVRCRLCEAALRVAEGDPSTLECQIWKGLQTSVEHQGSQVDFIQEVSPLLTLPDTQDPILLVSMICLELQVLDALLRICRNRLLKTALRLAKTQEHLEGSKRYSWLRKTDETTRRQRLIHAQAAYQFETERLGKVIAILQERPRDLEESILLEAMEQQTTSVVEQQPSPPPVRSPGIMQRFHPKHFRFPNDILSIPKTYKFPARLVTQVNSLLGTDTPENVAKLSKDLSSRIMMQQYASNRQWVSDAKAWTSRARNLLKETVSESLEKSTVDGTNEFSLAEWDSIDWSKRFSQQQWYRVLQYVHAQSSWRRLGESKVVRLGDAAIVDWTKRLDFKGIPSYLASLWLANLAHNRIRPHWPYLRERGLEVASTALAIAKARVWEPFLNLVDEIMNKGKGIMSAMGLDEEQQSLDHMLRDMGFGDGTAQSREDALQQAARQYEKDLASGVFVNLARGRLIRLLLVQVQQLKVGLLSALDTIDVLMKGNRIHFQILAVIPAVWITIYGTRFFLRALYNIRAKDLRPVRAVHSEMTFYLDQVERIMLLHSQGTGVASPGSALSMRHVGELHLYVHRYLILMDFSCPPFPSSRCDQLHSALQDLVNNPMNAGWLQSIRRKHQELLKYL